VHGSGRSVAEATERALEQLGVSEADAEIEVMSEPKTGLFGRVRGEALVKARVRPVEPRPKRQRRQGAGDGRGAAGRRPGGSGDTRRTPVSEADGAGGRGTAKEAPGGSGARRGGRRRGGGTAPRSDGMVAGGASEQATDGRSGTGASRSDAVKEESTVSEGVTLQEQAEVGKEFLEGLLDRYGLDAQVQIRELDDETVELAAVGEGLGLLVGPKGATLAALQDVTRTVVQRRFPNRTDRILVDVAGYRERRIAALRRFTEQLASEVLVTGEEQAMEPMSAADRKVVHDTVAAIEGVESRSQGDDPRRFVVIAPAS
jgi:spoIIIJ-associated protein